MDITIGNRNFKRKNPIKRNNMFFSEEDFRFEEEIMGDYIEQDMGQFVILYEVDLEKTQINDTYKEAHRNNIIFKTPVELPCVYEIEDSEMKPYDAKIIKGVYAKPGKLTFSVLKKHLRELNCDIKRGDYIGIDLDETTRKYWVVTDDGRVEEFSNKNTMYGRKSHFRKISAAYVDENEFKG